MIKYLFSFLSVIIFISCNEQTSDKVVENVLSKKEYMPIENEVGVQILEKKSFKKEWISNGKLIALQKNALQFDVSEQLESVDVKNGDFVKKGQQLAKLKAHDFQEQVDKAYSNFLKATFDFKDQLFARGYDFEEKDSIPKRIYEMVAMKSGYKDAQRELKKTEYDLKSINLIAPFKGKVANIAYKKHEYVNGGKEFLTLIDDRVFEVEFYLIESEIKHINIHDKVVVRPFALEQNYQGEITSINPMVGKNGTILVKAVVKNDGNLLEGMNVKVLIQKDVLEQFVVPKSAVILRQNKEILFKVVNGKAFWTYVFTTNENSQNYSVIPHPDKSTSELSLGDSIIVSGNLNLAHGSEVFATQKK